MKVSEKKPTVNPGPKATKKAHKKSLAASQALSMGTEGAPGGRNKNASPQASRQDLVNPCPCCGALASVHHFGELSAFRVMCVLCGMMTAPYTDEKNAIVVWNRRVQA